MASDEDREPDLVAQPLVLLLVGRQGLADHHAFQR
jgi:hypothetical protein